VKKSLSFVVLLTTSFICSMDQDPKSPRLAPEPSADMINKRRSSSSPFHPAVTRVRKQSHETFDFMKQESAGKIFDDKRGRTEDKK